MNSAQIIAAAQKVPASKKFGDKVFLSDVRAALAGCPTSVFKAAVLAGWERGELSLSRFDLVELFNEQPERMETVRKSQVVRGNAEAHLLRVG